MRRWQFFFSLLERFSMKNTIPLKKARGEVEGMEPVWEKGFGGSGAERAAELFNVMEEACEGIGRPESLAAERSRPCNGIGGAGRSTDLFLDLVIM